MTDRLVWIDCEMTGLNLERDALIEIACLVTDGELETLGEGLDLVIKPPPEALDQMEDVVREMHTTSGLLAELPAGVTLAEAQDQVLGYVRQYISEPRRVPLAGNYFAMPNDQPWPVRPAPGCAPGERAQDGARGRAPGRRNSPPWARRPPRPAGPGLPPRRRAGRYGP